MRALIYVLGCLLFSLIVGQTQQPQSVSVPPDQSALSNRIRELLDHPGAAAVKTTATAAASTTAATALDDEHKLVAGDKVNFRILEDREPAKSLSVTDSG